VRLTFFQGRIMRKLDTEILVIGGGATGTGIIRDLAMRGFKAVLVEKRDFSHGTTGRYHGLLHSGGRYAVKDPQAAKECIEENIILRRIMPHCLEDTGGFFVTTPWDDPTFAPKFEAGCKAAGIPIEEISISQMLREEPLLNPNITRCFRVPDGSADSFMASEMNVKAAQQYGAVIKNYHEVTRLIREGDRVVGAVCHDLVNDEDVAIHADMVINASGAWAGQIAATIGLEIHVVPGKGTMVAINHRVINTVVNRCKMPDDGDIIVPIHTVAVIGTTDEKVADPEHFAIEPWEVQLMLDEGEKLIPGLKEMRMVRAWAGVRPLYQETVVADTRDITRAYTLLDHEKRDGVAGFISMIGGKWTTYRQMAEVVVNRVCDKLGTERECRTHIEPLPGAEEHGYHHLGARLAEVEKNAAFNDLICECELATRADIEWAITEANAKTLDDIRRDVRLGMGPCQGGFCSYRAAAILHNIRRHPVEQTNVALRDFLQERWKGLLPILWGKQLRQERLDELIYLSIFNADHLPGEKASRLGPSMYEEKDELPLADHETSA
jgi:glycerol-3-phosphate dehydrogenase